MAAPKRENLWLSLVLNVVLPAIILTQGGKRFGLPPEVVLVVGLAFPVAYGLWDWFTRKVRNLISIIGAISVLLTGGIGLLQLPSEWIAIKEAAVPLGLAIMILVTAGTANPLVRVFLFRPEVFAIDRINAALDAARQRPALDRLLKEATLILAASFMLSAMLNYLLARLLVVSPSGTPEFNAEIGRMTALSFPVIALPSMVVTFFAMFRLIKGLQSLTGLSMEELMAQPPAAGVTKTEG